MTTTMTVGSMATTKSMPVTGSQAGMMSVGMIVVADVVGAAAMVMVLVDAIWWW